MEVRKFLDANNAEVFDENLKTDLNSYFIEKADSWIEIREDLFNRLYNSSIKYLDVKILVFNCLGQA